MMKKMIAILLCASLAAAFVSCGNEGKPSDSLPGSSAGVQVANPFQTFDNLDAAAELTGFSIELPDMNFDWVTEVVYRAKGSEMLEIIYHGDNDEYRIRKAKGSEDISGDYSTYTDTVEIQSGDKVLTAKGNDGKISAATWQDGDFTYSISFQIAVDKETAAEIVKDIK